MTQLPQPPNLVLSETAVPAAGAAVSPGIPEADTSRAPAITDRTAFERDFEFKLISVTYREAAMDLPSFRAAANHMDTQLQQLEDWFMALVDLFMKVPLKIEEFRSVVAILDYLVPSYLQDNLLDQEYSAAMFQQLRQTLQGLWTMAFLVFRINVASLEQRRAEFSQHVLRFRLIRREFLRSQEHYDHAYDTHMATPKFRDPALLFEDLRQLAAARRDYMLRCIALVADTEQVSEALNRTVLALNELFWRAKLEHLKGSLVDTTHLARVSRAVTRLRAWHDACLTANDALHADLAAARRNVEAHVAQSLAPAGSVDEYRPEYINARVLAATDETAAEKHGYLCVKAGSDKQNRPKWERRWAYVRDGVLGFLVLASGRESVQETDQIGVLLCSVRHAPNEDRHFCFEVRTIDSTFVLQAETLRELRSWLRVFENARLRITNPEDPMHVYLTAASTHAPPPVAEFLAPTTSAIDRELTSRRTRGPAGQVLAPRRLLPLVERHSAFLLQPVLEDMGRLNLPLVTASTRTALISSILAIPAAGAEANLCGSSNWALRAMLEIPSRSVAVEPLQPDESQEIGGISYPKTFPNSWVARDLQMRALFGPAVAPHEHCLVAYNCLLVANGRQELRATHYVSQAHVYSYVHTLGFVSMAKIPLNRFVLASCSAGKTHDTLRLVLVHGQLVIRVFFEDGVLLLRKLNFLFQNLARSAPLTTLDVIAELLAIDNAHAKEMEAPPIPAVSSSVPQHFEFLTKALAPEGCFLEAATLENLLPLMAKRAIKLPPNAVFHVLCGSESEILNVFTAMVDVQFSERNAWKRSGDDKEFLVRDNRSVFRLPSGQRGSIKVNQQIEAHVDNEFYSIKVTKSALKVFCGPRLQFVARVTIQKMEGGRSSVKIYGKHIIDESPLKSFIAKRLCNMFIRGFTAHVFRELEAASNIIGTKGSLLKAVYFYGKILVSDDPYEPVVMDPVQIGRYGLLSVCLKIMAADAFRALAFWGTVILNAVSVIFHKFLLHKTLLGIVGILLLSNAYLSTLSAHSYWLARQSRGLAKDLLEVEPMKILRAVYLQDIQDLVNNEFSISSDSACFQAFRNQSVVLNFHTFMSWDKLFQEPSLSLERQFRHERLSDIASKRNELLISMNLLNNLEEQEAKAEWREWLVSELATCNQIARLDLLKHGGLAGEELHPNLQLLTEYCDSCSLELAEVSGII